MGKNLTYFVSIGALVATLSVLLTTLLGLSRISFAMAREHDLPQLFTKLDKSATPYFTVLVFGFIMTILSLFTKENLKKLTNEYGMGKSPVGMDDFWALVQFKQKEFYSVEGRDYFKGLDEANVVLKKITAAWDNKILPILDAKFSQMKAKDKIKLFNDTKVFE